MGSGWKSSDRVRLGRWVAAVAGVSVLAPLIATGVLLWVLGMSLGFGRWTHTRGWNTPEAGMAGLVLQGLAVPLTATLARAAWLLIRWALDLGLGPLVPWWLAAASFTGVGGTFVLAPLASARADMPVAAFFVVGVAVLALGVIATRALAVQQGAWPLGR